MNRGRRKWSAAAAAAFLLEGCSATSPETRDQLFGALAGAAGGAAIGALATGGDREAILAGAAAGALVGWGAVKLSQYAAEKKRTAAAEAKALGYRPAQGTVVKIRSASATPGQVKPGEKITFETDYAVLAPADTKSVAVKESWELSKDGKVLSRMPPKQQTREPGGWIARASIEAPKNADAGTYVVKHRVEAGTSYDERLAAFVVQP
jgi:hypothetical protein